LPYIYDSCCFIAGQDAKLPPFIRHLLSHRQQKYLV